LYVVIPDFVILQHKYTGKSTKYTNVRSLHIVSQSQIYD
jgi:hypothetical protein